MCCKSFQVDIDSLLALIKSKKKAVHAGPLSQQKVVKDALLSYIFEIHEQGISVNTFMIVLKASLLSNDFRKKCFTAWCSAIKQFILSYLFVYQMGTHMSQHPQIEVKSKATDYM